MTDFYFLQKRRNRINLGLVMRKTLLLGAAGVFSLAAPLALAEEVQDRSKVAEEAVASAETVGAYVLSIKGAG